MVKIINPPEIEKTAYIPAGQQPVAEWWRAGLLAYVVIPGMLVIRDRVPDHREDSVSRGEGK